MILFRKIIPFLLIVCISCHTKQEKSTENTAAIPTIDGEFWRIGAAPDLDSLNGEDLVEQQMVDHGFIQDVNGKWQLWACIRDCFYNSAGIRIMTSKDSANYERPKFKNNCNLLYDKGGRDVMVMKEGDTYFSYSTISTLSKDGWPRGFVSVRTSKDLKKWSDYTVVSEGDRAGNGNVSAESPFVLKYQENFYLFRSSSSTGTTFVYRSKDPYNFGIHNDEKLVEELPVWAPEIIYEGGQWYISDLGDFQGIMLAKLKWE